MAVSPVSKPGLGRDFAALWAASATANLGDAMYLIGLPLLALGLQASPGEVAAVTVLLTLGWPLFGLAAGLLADRYDRRRLVMIVNAGRCAVLGALALLIVAGELRIGWIYAAAFLLGIGETIVDSSFAALIPSTVRDPGMLGRANARIEFATNVTNQFVGPPLAGLLAAVGIVWVTGTGSILYLATLPLLGIMAGSYLAMRPGPREPFRLAVTSGLRFIWRHPLLRTLTFITASMNVLWAALTAVLIVFAVAPGPLGLSPAGYGLMLTAMAVGGVAGSALVEPLRRRLGDHRVMALDVLGTVLMLAAPALTTNPYVIGAALLVAGAGSAVWRIIGAVIRQSVAPPDRLARVYSASRVISWGVLPVGAGLGGLVAELYGVRTVFAAGAVAGLAVLAAYGLTVRPAALAAAVAQPATATNSMASAAPGRPG